MQRSQQGNDGVERVGFAAGIDQSEIHGPRVDLRFRGRIGHRTHSHQYQYPVADPPHQGDPGQQRHDHADV